MTITELGCAQWARALALDPVGTAGCYQAYLLVECPLPWPRDIAELPELAPLRPLVAAAGARLQGLVAPRKRDRRVALYRRREPFTDFWRAERTVAATDGSALAQAVEQLFALEAGDGETPGHEVLICTHGRRDRCCGSMGIALAAEVMGPSGPLSGGPGPSGAAEPSTAVWRTSHTGGHRFAPTAIVLPEGTSWAFADADVLARVVARRGPIDDLLPRYRGCAGLDSARLQAAERAVLAEVGWELFDCSRWGSDAGEGPVQLHVGHPSGTVSVWAADVEVGREVPLPDCGDPLEQARKSERELVVRELRWL